jgi:hypothetical protein
MFWAARGVAAAKSTARRTDVLGMAVIAGWVTPLDARRLGKVASANVRFG